MNALGPVPQPGILDISPYVGGELKAPGIRNPARLASNESALGPSPMAIEAYRHLAHELHRYPDGNSLALRQAIARHFDLDAARIICGDGSDELFGMLATAYAGQGDEVLYSRHGFLAYPIVARAAGATPVTAPETDLKSDVDALLGAVTVKTRIVFLANPNNPTGSYLTIDEIRRLHDGLPQDVLLVLDGAYAEFVDRKDYSAGFELVRAHRNVVVTRTFSKIYGLAALRLGWAYGPPEIIDVLNRIRSPFNVSLPAQAAGIAALDDREFLAAAKAHNDRWLPWLASGIAALGLKVYPSVGNFVLVSTQPYDADAVWRFLKERGVLTRQMGGYGLPDCLRISVGREEEVRALVDSIGAFVAEHGAS